METTTRLNRLRVVLAEQNRSNHWLADKLQKSDYTVSRWVTNKQQPSVAQLFEIAKVLNVDVRDLLMSSQSDLK
jgi:transcriptional regulator with XRE-family HTH domain